MSLHTTSVSTISARDSLVQSEKEDYGGRTAQRSCSELQNNADGHQMGRRSNVIEVVRDDVCHEDSKPLPSRRCCSYCSCPRQDMHEGRYGTSCAIVTSTTETDGPGSQQSKRKNMQSHSTEGYDTSDERVGVVELVCGVNADEAVAALNASRGDVIAAFEVALSVNDRYTAVQHGNLCVQREELRRETKNSQWEVVRRRKKTNRKGRK